MSPGSWTPGDGPKIAILYCCHFRPIWPRSHFFVIFLNFLMTWRNHGPALSLSIGTVTSVTRAAWHCQLHLPPSLAIQPVPLPFLSVGIPPSVHLCCSCLSNLTDISLSFLLTQYHPQPPSPSNGVLKGSTPQTHTSTGKWFPKQGLTMPHPLLTLP